MAANPSILLKARPGFLYCPEIRFIDNEANGFLRIEILNSAGMPQASMELDYRDSTDLAEWLDSQGFFT